MRNVQIQWDKLKFHGDSVAEQDTYDVYSVYNDHNIPMAIKSGCPLEEIMDELPDIIKDRPRANIIVLKHTKTTTVHFVKKQQWP